MTPAEELARELAAGGTAADARRLATLGAEAVAALAPFLATGWGAEVSAATALRMVHGAGVVPALVGLTASPDAHTRNCAIDALGHSRSREALAPLLGLLDRRRRVEPVARALGELGFPEAIPALEAHWARADLDLLLSDPEEYLPELWDLAAVGGALLRLGRGGVEPALARLAAAPDVAVALEAVRALRWSGHPIAAAALRAAMSDPRDEVADAAVEALGALGLPAVAPLLLEAAEAEALRFPAVWWAFRSLFGDEVPNTEELAALRRWWEPATGRWPPDRPLWWGGADPGQAILRLPEADGGIARTRLELWTGVDLVDAAEPGVAGDHHDVRRALLWWDRARQTWDADAVYRARRRLDVGPVLRALQGAT